MTKVTFFNSSNNIHDFLEQIIARSSIDGRSPLSSCRDIPEEYYPQIVELFLREQGDHYMDYLPDEAMFGAIKSFFNIEQLGGDATTFYQSILDFNENEIDAILEEVNQDYLKCDEDYYDDPQELSQPVKFIG